jgi:hypothetical protein
MLMAAYGWVGVKHHIEQPTLKQALTYPITCEWGKNREFCTHKKKN